MAQYDTADTPRVSGWAIGGITFAGTMLMLIGVFHAIDGLTAILNDEFFVVTQNYVRSRRHGLGLGALSPRIVLVITGLGLWAQRPWAGVVGIVLAMLSAIANFFFIPYYPFWAILVIGLDVWMLWALTRPGAMRT